MILWFQVVQLAFHQFELHETSECRTDSVKLYNGMQENRLHLITDLCGRHGMHTKS